MSLRPYMPLKKICPWTWKKMKFPTFSTCWIDDSKPKRQRIHLSRLTGMEHRNFCLLNMLNRSFVLWGVIIFISNISKKKLKAKSIIYFPAIKFTNSIKKKLIIQEFLILYTCSSQFSHSLTAYIDWYEKFYS